MNEQLPAYHLYGFSRCLLCPVPRNLAAPYLDMEVHNPIPAPHLSKVRNHPVTQPDFSPLHVFTTGLRPGFLSLNPIDDLGSDHSPLGGG